VVLVQGHNALSGALVKAESSLTAFRKTAEATALSINRKLSPGLVADQGVFYSVVRLLKPAHTRALIVSLLTVATWDDWPLDEPEKELDSGFLDEWQPTP